LGLGAHVFLIIFLLPFLVIGKFRKIGTIWNSKTILFSILLSILGLSIYLYTPIRASSDTAICWGKPSNLERLVGYVTQEQYSVKKGARDFSDFLFLLKKWIILLPLEYGILCTILIAIGALIMLKKRPFDFSLILSIILLNMAIVYYYGVGREFHNVYHIPMILLSSIFMIGLSQSAKIVNTFKDKKHVFWILPIVIIFLFTRNYFVSNRDQHENGYLHGLNIMNTMNKNSIFFGETDTALFPMYYLSFVEGYRKDLTLIDRQRQVVSFLEGNKARINPAEELKIIKQSSNDVYYGEYPRIEEIESIEYGIIHKVIKNKDIDHFSSSNFQMLYNNFFETKNGIYKDQWTRELIAIYYLLYGNFLMKDGQQDFAKRAFETATELGKDQIGLLNNLAIYYEAMQDIQKSASILDMIISKVKKNEAKDYIYKKAQLFYRAKEYDKAEMYFQESLDNDKKNPWVYYYLGNISLIKGDVNRAIDNFNISINLNPTNYYAYLNLAVIYQKIGMLDNAALSFEKILSIKPDIPECYFNLVRIYSTMKQKDKAIYWLEKGMHLFNDEMVKTLLESPELEYLRSFPEFERIMNQRTTINPIINNSTHNKK
jgi:tetratricopeptide (TPR) repeat protein